MNEQSEVRRYFRLFNAKNKTYKKEKDLYSGIRVISDV